MKKSLLLPLFLNASLNAGFIFEIGPSYRVDWQNQESHILEDIPAPPFHDQDRYNNVSIWEIDGQIATDHCNPFYVGVEAKYGWVTSGSGNYLGLFVNGPAQFFETDRTNISGHTYDLDLFAGYRLYYFCNRLSVIPVGGYEHHEKRFTQNNGRFSLNSNFANLTRTNNFLHVDHIRGPFAGLEFEYVHKCAFLLFGSFHWNWYLYTARSSVSFDRVISATTIDENFFKGYVNSRITGPSFQLGLSYNVTDHAYLCLRSTYYYTYLAHGRKTNSLTINTFTRGEESAQAFAETVNRLNQFKWESWAIQLFLGYDF